MHLSKKSSIDSYHQSIIKTLLSQLLQSTPLISVKRENKKNSNCRKVARGKKK
jgi:hypothetical protein